ncbi:magnesium/cobalt transporter CorA [Nocardioides sp. Iso805N]|uniref:magnesium/cobalt transporter CorA n=1 Tax=Nocardioides sp. Iso805N TaxID=1283287 RepID=UPI00036FD3B8|nr:magnesium/cobalt transporter CorA [Nocardioides sp. Iso805N]
MIVDSALYRNGERVDLASHPHEYHVMREGVRNPGDFVWLGLYRPSERELAEVAEAFGLHPLAVEDALKAHQRPKLERYGEMMFLVLKTLWYVDADDAVETGEINVFMGSDFVITVRHGRGSQLAPARHLLESDERRLLTQGPSSAIYAVADYVVDGYLSVISELVKDVDEVETSVFSPARTSDSERIYALKRELVEVRRAVLPLRDPIRRFATAEYGERDIDDDIRPFFRDVLDHLNQGAEAVDSLELLLSSAFDAHLARIQVQQNDDMRKISAGAAIIVVPTLVAGVYGMNFDHMPELHWRFGYAYALIVMASSVTALWWWFRRSGWL